VIGLYPLFTNCYDYIIALIIVITILTKVFLHFCQSSVSFLSVFDAAALAVGQHLFEFFEIGLQTFLSAPLKERGLSGVEGNVG
jgi:hypothetical protein